MSIFTKELHEYKQYMNPLQDYMETMASFFSKKYNLNYNEVKSYIKEYLKTKGLRQPIVFYNKKDKNGDMHQTSSKIIEYINSVKEDQDIIVPTFTTYKNHDEQRSLHGIFIDINKNARSVDKKKMFQAKASGDKDAFEYYNVVQNNRKINNNSLSGAYASNGTIFFNESGHSTLTSLTRCVSGIGNAISEIVVGGNRYFKDPESVINYILTICKHVDYTKVQEAVNLYNLYIPTVHDVYSTLFLTAKWYWRSNAKESEIQYIISKLTDLERVAVCYVNDLWTLKKYNDSLLRDFMGNISLPASGTSEDPLEDLKEVFEGQDNLVRYIFAKEIQGKQIDYKSMVENNDLLIHRMAMTSRRIKETFNKYSLLLRAFFLTDILPPNIAYIKDMYRLNIVLSDTDSTCCAYDKWVDWFFNGNPDVLTHIGVAGGIMTITTQLIAHNLKVFYHNLNIKPRFGDLLQMKNEYFWTVFVTSNKSKHYYASTMIREGVVYKELEREKKGVHFIASTFDKIIQDTTNELMDYVTNQVGNFQEVSIDHMCRRVMDVENKILEDFHNRKYYMFKKDNIKAKGSYKQDEDRSKYVYHKMWNEIFGEKYGYVEEPPYNIYNIPLDLDNPTDFKDMLDNIGKMDMELQKRFISVCEKYDKKNITTLRIPTSILDSQGIPKEVMQYVGIKKTILQMCYSLYEILTTVGFFKKDFQLVSEVYNV